MRGGCFQRPDFIVIDELHSFLQGPRGLHLASLLRRIDAMAPKPARRVGLSATIGDLPQAAKWLRPGNHDEVEILEAKTDAPELRLQIRGYVEPPELDDPDHAEGGSGAEESAAKDRAGCHRGPSFWNPARLEQSGFR